MSKIEVDAIDKQSGSTLTLGGSGTAVTLAAGATQSGFGATGAVSWSTTVKTGDFTAVASEGYFVNTTSGEIDVTLPAGTAGAIVAVADYANTADTNNIILKQNGSDKIEGSTDDFLINQEGASVTLVFVDSTKGWIITDTGNSSDVFTSNFICATGGTISCSGNCRIHTFTGPGTFTVNNAAVCAANNVVSYLVVAGGGSGGANRGGGGGAGGFREDKSPVTPYTASPLDGAGAITVTATGFPIAVGAGGAAVPSNQGNAGAVSTFSTITSAGGGGGGSATGSPVLAGLAGGSGGGAAGPASGGAGNTPPVTPAQGNGGGNGNGAAPYAAGGGGGAACGGSSGSTNGGAGGAGATTSISGSPVQRGGGGGGATNGNPVGAGGAGGGGTAGVPGVTGCSATANTGGGGGGGGGNGPGGSNTSGSGGSGIVIIRYKFK
jgi:hypothetical protein